MRNDSYHGCYYHWDTWLDDRDYSHENDRVIVQAMLYAYL